MSYDAARFLTTDTWTDPASQAVSRVYDAPGRMTTAKNSASNDIARYTYDADGHRTRYRREISGCAAQGSGRWVRAG
jgi:YD repeat-containing protein